MVLALLAAALFCAPFAAAWQYQRYRQAVERQTAAPVARLSGPAGAAVRRAADGTGPVVLAYHDVRPGGGGPYTVPPRRFAAQLTALRAAGYRTVDSAAFTRFLRGGRLPARSVYLTFDDGAQGLWRYADPILAAHGMHGAAYLITGHVGRRHSYYLSWDEVRAMARSGRWDFQSHTWRAHRHAAVDAAGRLGPALADRLWLPAAHRVETPAEYCRRVSADLDRSVADITGHGLPRPTLFAYPFSEAADRSGLPAAGPVLGRLLRARFAAALTNVGSRPLPAGARAAAAGEVQRLEVTARTTVAQLLARLADRAEVPPGAHPYPLREPARWRFAGDPPGTGLGAFTGRGPWPGRRRYLTAAYLPFGSADWSAYTAEATVSRLYGTRAVASVTVRDGSRRPVRVSVTRGWARVMAGGRRRTVALRHLSPASYHRLRLTVAGRTTTVTVDSLAPVTVTAPAATAAGDLSGGLALGVGDGGTGHRPAVTALTVTAAPAGPRPPVAGGPVRTPVPPTVALPVLPAARGRAGGSV
ncbi:polysaccharide deacetylase family protein [Streptomyces sp. HPF1205]|uniref:polysaccharide deacetylase family protein n=1 Tax=Streptomyces sp. HPF1205 TaxID=2873262 RepID=UPI001CEC3EF8|nr:polysaccharide deacetylase family protein [Streptomyces sp. HPF1205]